MSAPAASYRSVPRGHEGRGVGSERAPWHAFWVLRGLPSRNGFPALRLGPQVLGRHCASHAVVATRMALCFLVVGHSFTKPPAPQNGPPSPKRKAACLSLSPVLTGFRDREDFELIASKRFLELLAFAGGSSQS